MAISTALILLSFYLSGICAAPPARVYLPDEDKTPSIVKDQFEVLGVDILDKANASVEQADFVWASSDDISSILSEHPRLSFKINSLPGATDRLASPAALFAHLEAKQQGFRKYYFAYTPEMFVLPRDSERLNGAMAWAKEANRLDARRSRDRLIDLRFMLWQPPYGLDSISDPSPKSSIFLYEQEWRQQVKAYPARGEKKDAQAIATKHHDPLLIDGRRFELSFYVAIVSLDPLRIYIHDNVLAKFATKVYPSIATATTQELSHNFDPYFAPWDLAYLQKDFYELPSPNREGTNSWRIVKRAMAKAGVDIGRFKREVYAAVTRTIASQRSFFIKDIEKLGHDVSNFFALYQFDFEVDERGKAWFMRIHTDPSLDPVETTFGTDEALKKAIVQDLIHLVGISPFAEPSYEDFQLQNQAQVCTDMCTDTSKVFEVACWVCPGWFTKDIARKLFQVSNEYSRRGRFQLVHPSLTGEDESQFLDTPMSELEQVSKRYFSSLSLATSSDRFGDANGATINCLHRDHCSDHGDCVNGKCRCDVGFEGKTCYIPLHASEVAKPLTVQRPNATTEKVTEPMQLAHEEVSRKELERLSWGRLIMAFAVLLLVLWGGYRFFLPYMQSAEAYKSS